ncbi:MAG TPA: glycoside hydrolase family 3 C-terminal domain-containing protein [Acidimicrobiales bacterium]|nr:glycoside hydrolase family 3 C-terminal domain-containing protein [Acidimicrobiales bacterium]
MVAQANAVLAKMTLAEQFDLVGTGVVHDPSLGIPPLRFQDGPNGIGEGAKGVTQFPNAQALAATFNVALAGAYGQALGAEAAGKGVTALGAPTINVVRSPLWGREAETFGEDPFLTSLLAAAEIKGIQSQHVMAVAKHYVAYDQETGRMGLAEIGAPADNAMVAARTLQEIYDPPFRAAANAGVAAVMCAYNQIDGAPACENAATLGDLRAMGFLGFVEPDEYLAVRHLLAAATAGVNNFELGSALDASPGERGGRIEEAALRALVASGALPASVITGSARRILIGMAEAGLLHATVSSPQPIVTTPAHQALAATIAEQGAVLLQNTGSVLPLAPTTARIAVIGADAGPGVQDDESGSAAVYPSGPVTSPYAAIAAAAGAAGHGQVVTYTQGTTGVVPFFDVPGAALWTSRGVHGGLTRTVYRDPWFLGRPVSRGTDHVIGFSTPAPWRSATGTAPFSVRWTGAIVAPSSGTYTFSLTTCGWARLFIGNRLVTSGGAAWVHLYTPDGSHGTTFQGTAVLRAGVPVPIKVEYSTEQALAAPEMALGWAPQTAKLLAGAVAAARSADVAVVFASDVAGEGMDRTSLALPGDQNQLIAAVAAVNPHTIVVLNTSGPVLMPWQPKVAGIIEDWYPGEAVGTAIASVLFGTAEPSGRLPVTFPATAQQGSTATRARFPGVDNQVSYDDALDVGYRYYDQFHQTPLFPFGFGLSYTSFTLGTPHLSALGGYHYSVAVPVTNTGARTGAEVVELYVQDPAAAGEPPLQLKGVAKLTLAPGATGTATIPLNGWCFASVDAAGAWQVTPGTYQLWVGTSSASLPSAVSVTLKAGAP